MLTAGGRQHRQVLSSTGTPVLITKRDNRVSYSNQETGSAMDVAGIITAVGGVIALLVKVGSMAPRKRKQAAVIGRLEHLERRLEIAEDRLLGWAAWAHDARVNAASHGVRLPSIPGRLLGAEDIPTPRQSSDVADRSDHA
jgi:hypothetical protein